MDKLKIYKPEIEAAIAEGEEARKKCKKLLKKLIKDSKLGSAGFAKMIGLSRQALFRTLKIGSSVIILLYLKRILKIIK